MIEVKLKQITKKFCQGEKTTVVLCGLSFVFSQNEFYCLFGPSGYGKTTILNLVAGLTTPEKGKVSLKRIVKNKRKKIDSLKIGYVFQENRLLPWKTVAENIDFVLKPVFSSRSKRQRTIKHYLTLVGLPRALGKYPRSLSGGEKQRVSLARALAIDPDIILMDEPFAHLDDLVATKLRKDLINIWEASPKMVLFVTHNILEALYLADRILVLPRKPVSHFEEVIVSIPRPRDQKLYEELIFHSEIQSSIKKIKEILVKDSRGQK